MEQDRGNKSNRANRTNKTNRAEGLMGCDYLPTNLRLMFDKV